MPRHSRATPSSPRFGDRSTATTPLARPARAGCGQGKDDPPPDEAAKPKFRRQALDWLKAELAAWAKVLEGGPAEVKATIAPTLEHWTADADLAGIRDEKELAKLSEKERADFKQLWKDVDQLLTKAAGSK